MKDFFQNYIKLKNGKKIKRKDLTYNINKCKYNFQQYEIRRSFDESIYAGKITKDEAEEDQSNL